MALLGLGAFVAWHGITDGREADYECWHSRSYVSAATRAGWNTKYHAPWSRLSDKPLTNKNI